MQTTEVLRVRFNRRLHSKALIIFIENSLPFEGLHLIPLCNPSELYTVN